MKKQTAVEWFLSQMTHKFYISYDVIQKAIDMEKEIIVQAFEDGDYNYFYNRSNGREFENGVEYYNEKFKSE